MKRKLKYTGQIHWLNMRLPNKGKSKERRTRGRPRLAWLYAVDWTGIDTYERIKRRAEDRSRRTVIAVDLFIEDGSWWWGWWRNDYDDDDIWYDDDDDDR